MRYPQGATVTLTFTVKDATGTLTDASPISLTVHKPDGTPTAGSPYTPTRDSVGTYHENLPLSDTATLGHYQYVLTATIGSTAAVQSGVFDVSDPFTPEPFSLDDVKAHLNITSSTYDAELQTFIDMAEAAMRQRIGPLTVTAFTSRVRGYTSALRLPVFPVVALTSVTPVGGAALDITSIQVVPDALRLVEYVVPGGWFASPWYDVAYTAGRAVSAAATPDIYKDGLELLRYAWMTQRSPVGGSESDTSVAFAARVNELMSPYMPLGIG